MEKPTEDMGGKWSQAAVSGPRLQAARIISGAVRGKLLDCAMPLHVIRPFTAPLLAVMLLAASPAWAQRTVALELVLAVDCSSSVDEDEFELQMRGLARAFEHPGVLGALEQTGTKGIAVALMQWSGAGQQAIAIDWQLINSSESALAFSRELDATPRFVSGGATAIGPAIEVAKLMLEQNAYLGERMVIDVSGDGRANEGGPASVPRLKANRAGITVNGLAILKDEPDLAVYYVAGVVGGPGAFLLTADDFNDFARATRRKLYFEISGPPIAALPRHEAPSVAGLSD